MNFSPSYNGSSKRWLYHHLLHNCLLKCVVECVSSVWNIRIHSGEIVARFIRVCLVLWSALLFYRTFAEILIEPWPRYISRPKHWCLLVRARHIWCGVSRPDAISCHASDEGKQTEIGLQLTKACSLRKMVVNRNGRWSHGLMVSSLSQLLLRKSRGKCPPVPRAGKMRTQWLVE